MCAAVASCGVVVEYKVLQRRGRGHAGSHQFSWFWCLCCTRHPPSRLVWPIWQAVLANYILLLPLNLNCRLAALCCCSNVSWLTQHPKLHTLSDSQCMLAVTRCSMQHTQCVPQPRNGCLATAAWQLCMIVQPMRYPETPQSFCYGWACCLGHITYSLGVPCVVTKQEMIPMSGTQQAPSTTPRTAWAKLSSWLLHHLHQLHYQGTAGYQHVGMHNV
jgi:hypothetical protein